MARRVFFSFHFANDFWRTQQVRNINALEGQTLCSPNDWEEVKRRGDAAIENWIDEQMSGKSCIIVLVGSQTASRPWVLREIVKAWNGKKGVLGIRINGLKDKDGRTSAPGDNPFIKVTLANSTKTLAEYAPLKTPSGIDSKAIYGSIADNIERWIEEAVSARGNYPGK